MKKSIIFFGAILFASFFVLSCGNNNQQEMSDLDSKSEELAKQKDSEELAKQEKLIADSINNLLNGIKVTIFNHSGLVFDPDGWCMNGNMAENPKISQVKDFESSYNCKKGNYIQKLTINGDFNGLDIYFMNKKGDVIKEFKNFNLQKSITFSTIDHQPDGGGGTIEKKDKDYQKWFESCSKIELSFKDSIFYIAEWKSNGWFYTY